jgi:hypothetical protein
MIHQTTMMAAPVFETFTMQMDTQPQKAKNVDLFRLCGQFFSPVGNPERQISIPMSWAPFFTTKLLNKTNFE